MSTIFANDSISTTVMVTFVLTQKPRLIFSWFKRKLALGKVTFLSLFYNDFISWPYVVDTLLEPAYWVVDTFAKALGPIFVVGDFILTSSVVAIAYSIGLPYYWENKGPYVAVPIVIIGQFFFINVVFHYWKALTTHPGRVPTSNTPHSSQDKQYDDNSVVIKQVTSVCKKCIAPKPPRTHHCSVCDSCCLKMDHHCPWLNGCVGHFNHRYFFLYMVYTVLGCLFLMILGFEILWHEVFPETTINDLEVNEDLANETNSSSNNNPKDELKEEFSLFSRHSLIMYESFITTGCFLVLGGLCIWHAKLISRGETSIEAHINRSERKRHKELGNKPYRNPYDFGAWYNWCLFLGMTDGRGWACVLFPSCHKPHGDGLEWDTIYGCDIKWNEFSKKPSRLDPIKIA